MTGVPRRGSSGERNHISSLANLVGIKQRAHVKVKEAKSKVEHSVLVGMGLLLGSMLKEKKKKKKEKDRSKAYFSSSCFSSLVAH